MELDFENNERSRLKIELGRRGEKEIGMEKKKTKKKLKKKGQKGKTLFSS